MIISSLFAHHCCSGLNFNVSSPVLSSNWKCIRSVYCIVCYTDSLSSYYSVTKGKATQIKESCLHLFISCHFPSINTERMERKGGRLKLYVCTQSWNENNSFPFRFRSLIVRNRIRSDWRPRHHHLDNKWYHYVTGSQTKCTNTYSRHILFLLQVPLHCFPFFKSKKAQKLRGRQDRKVDLKKVEFVTDFSDFFNSKTWKFNDSIRYSYPCCFKKNAKKSYDFILWVKLGGFFLWRSLTSIMNVILIAVHRKQ